MGESLGAWLGAGVLLGEVVGTLLGVPSGISWFSGTLGDAAASSTIGAGAGCSVHPLASFDTVSKMLANQSSAST